MEDLGALISEDDPFGGYLKSDRSAYRALRNAFNGGQTAYRALSETSESLLSIDLRGANSGAWSRLELEAGVVLREKSKDIEVFTWYIASCVHSGSPLANVGASLGVLADLVEADWSGLHPIPPEDKLRSEGEADKKKEIDSLKLGCLTQLFGEVPGGGLLHLPLTNLPIIGDFSYGQFVNAEKKSDIEPLRVIAGEIVIGDASGLATMIESLNLIASHAERLNLALRAVAATCGASPVPVGHLTKQVGEIVRMIRVLTQGSGFVWPGSDAREADGVSAGEVPTASQGGAGLTVSQAGSSLHSREAAFAALAELSRYFRSSEPHSPVHLLLDRALRWGQMPITDLYSELLGAESESFARVSLMSGLESFAHSGEQSGGGVSGQPIQMPALTNYLVGSDSQAAPSGTTLAAASAQEQPARRPPSVSDDDLPMGDFEM